MSSAEPNICITNVNAQYPRPKSGCCPYFDPFFYLLQLPSLSVLVTVLGGGILLVISPIMFGVWVLVRSVTDGRAPDPGELPIRAFIGMSCMILLGTCMGIVHRYLTKPEYRGLSVTFSDDLELAKCRSGIEFEVIDKRNTQLIGIDIKAEIISRISADESSSSTKIIFKSIPLLSPGTVAVPTRVLIPFQSLCPVPLRCMHCGEEHFDDYAKYIAHNQFYHQSSEFTPSKYEASIDQQLERIKYIRIHLAASDDISGRPAVAEKIYSRIPGLKQVSLFTTKKSFLALP